MTRDQQIEEMATIMSSRNRKGCPGCKVGKKSDCYQNATLLYNAGYRNDPEFTPVELRDVPDMRPRMGELKIRDVDGVFNKLFDLTIELSKASEEALNAFAFDSFYAGYPYIVVYNGWNPYHEEFSDIIQDKFIRFDEKPDLGELSKIYKDKCNNIYLYDFSKFTDADWIKLGFDPKNRR